MRKRILALVGDHKKEFLKMVNDRIEMLEKRLFSVKCKTGMKYEVDNYWLKQLRKIKGRILQEGKEYQMNFFSSSSRMRGR